jgi:hypothetical protein
VMWGVGQGQIVYNNHFGTYIYVYLDLCKSPTMFRLRGRY